MNTQRLRRWGDNDRHLGPFTFAFRESWRPIAAILSSSGGTHIRLQALGATMICELPRMLGPARAWVDLRGKEWSSSEGYWDEHDRDYGFLLHEGHLSISYGAQTHDSTTDKTWGCFLPWTQWRQISHVIYNADGSPADDVARRPYEDLAQAKSKATKRTFAFADYDGENLTATTYVERRCWRLGTGMFRWLGYIAPVKERRILNISFSGEVGRDKGSWKGGVIGTGIDMHPGESAEQAWLRFCQQNHRSKNGEYRITAITSVESAP